MVWKLSRLSIAYSGWFDRFLCYWQRPVIIGCVLLACFVLSREASSRQMLLILALIVASGVGLLILRHPPLGIFILLASIAIPRNGPSNSNLTLAMAAVLLGLWLLELFLHTSNLRLARSRAFLPLLMLVLVATFAWVVGQLPWYHFAQHAPMGAQLAGLALFYLSVGLFFVAAHRLQDLRWLKRAVGLFLGMGAFVVLGQLLPSIVGKFSGQLFGTQALGSLFWTWLLTLAVSQTLFNDELQAELRMALGGLSLATLFVMLTSMWAWNSGWVPPLASVGFMILIARPRLALSASLVSVPFILYKLSTVITLLMVGDNAYSYSTRLEAWAIVWNIVKVSPLLGLGPANYYWYTPLFGIRGYYVSFNSHQQYMDLIAQIGFLGLFCYLWCFVAIGLVAWRLYQRTPTGFARAYILGALGGVVGTLVAGVFGDWVIPFFYNVSLGGFRASMLSWLFLGGLVALEQSLPVSADPRRNQPTSETRFFADINSTKNLAHGLEN